MDLKDYELPIAEEYAPRPRASQAVAAKHRAQAGTSTPATEPIAPRSPPQHLIIGAVGVISIIGVLLLLASQQRTPAQPLAITPGPSTAAYLAAPTATQDAPVATEAPTAPTATIDAYAAPDGQLLGPIGLDRTMRPVAHYGAGWVQVDVKGSGVVWLRASDVPTLAITGPDLAPVAAQVEPPQTGRGLTVDQNGDQGGDQGGQPADVAPPEPPIEPATAVAWPTSAPAKAPDFAQPSTSATCKLIGCLGNLAVQSTHEQACHALYWQYGDSESIPEPDNSAVRACTWEGLYR